LIIEDFLATDEVATLENALSKIIDEMDPEKENRTAFSTNTEKVEVSWLSHLKIATELFLLT
jgi:hypothetical protein